MEFFFPDSQDQVNPLFNMLSEEHVQHRVRQRDDRYAHEVLRESPYDGLLVSKAIVDGSAKSAGKYTMAQSQRIYRLGAHRFFRTKESDRPLTVMGDCGAFNYASEPEPPYSVDEVIDFYDGVGLDRGVSVDHIVFAYLNRAQRESGTPVEPEWRRRRELTITLAGDFRRRVRARRCKFEPVGVAHGWDPTSYATSVKELQRMGYKRIAVGGLVPLKTQELREVVAIVGDVRRHDVAIHLLGVTRTEHMPEFAASGVTSFDSTSPFRQAFKDDTDNYYTATKPYTALRVPQVDGNTRLKKLISAGQIDQRIALRAEKRCLAAIRRFDRSEVSVDHVVEVLRDYEHIWDAKKDRSEVYRETLEAAPWQSCHCGICERVGAEVIIFRGSERNKRRGFHNLAVFREALDTQIKKIAAQQASNRCASHADRKPVTTDGEI
jgi:hypothetical protein